MNLNMRYLAVLVSLLLITQVHYCKSNEQKHEIKLEAGGEIILENPKFEEIPKSYETVVWKIVSPIGTTITLACDSTRKILNEECTEGYFMIDHERDQYCGSEHQIEIKSTNNRLTVSFYIQWYNAVVNCKASATTLDNRTVQRTIKRTIKLTSNEIPYHLQHVIPSLNQATIWEFTSISPGYRVGLLFHYQLHMDKRAESCMYTNITINIGLSQEVICQETNNVVKVSDGDTVSITLHTTEGSSGIMDCMILPTIGPNREPWKNVQNHWDEDINTEGVEEIKGPKGTSCRCGWSNKPKKRLLSDIKTGPHEFPWMVSVRFKDAPICGGAIITEYHVMTAAHCLERRSAESISVAAGINDLLKEDDCQIIQAVNFYYPNVNFASSRIPYVVDISVIVLEEKIIFSNKVGPVCMPANIPENFYGDKVTMMGWGRIILETESRPLRKATLLSIRSETCSITVSGLTLKHIAPESHICAWSDKADVFYGDSGGPLVWLDPETNRFTLVGVLATKGRGEFEVPSSYGSVIHFYNWTLDRIKESAHADANVCIRLD